MAHCVRKQINNSLVALSLSLSLSVCPIAYDCKAWHASGANESGVYPIKPGNGPAFQVSINYIVLYSINFLLY